MKTQKELTKNNPSVRISITNGQKELKHTVYSPDLAPLDFLLVQTGWWLHLSELTVLKTILHHYQNISRLKENYAEEINYFFEYLCFFFV